MSLLLTGLQLRRHEPRSSSIRRRFRAALVGAVTTALVPAALTSIAPAAAAAGPVSYYVDCSAGNDAATGLTTLAPWRTLARANKATLLPGDQLLLKRGCAFTGPLNARWAGTSLLPITIGAYGTGNLPIIQNTTDEVVITGSYQVMQYINAISKAPLIDTGCNNAPAGWVTGFRFMGSAAYNTIRYSVASNAYAGIFIGGTSHHNKILSNTLTNNNVKNASPTNDGGAVGIAVESDDNEVAYNTITGTDACSEMHTRDGSAIEVYAAQRNNIHHNRAMENNNFVELGNARTADNTIAYNFASSTLTMAAFLVTRGRLDTTWGPVLRTKAYNNTAYLTGSQSYAVMCIYGCATDVLTFKNNIVWANDRVGYSDYPFDESNNIFWRAGGSPKVWFATISSTDKLVDPRFVNAAANDLHLAAGSPAIDTGVRDTVTALYTADLDGDHVPQGVTIDRGMDERPTTATVVASDGYTRTLTGGWGTAETGGAYSYGGTLSDFAVNGSTATMRAPVAGASREVVLAATSALDVDSSLRFATDKVPTGSGQYVYLNVRRVDSKDLYRAIVKVTSTGYVYLEGGRVVAGVSASLGTAVSAGQLYAAGAYLRVRTSVTGTAPATMRIRVWKDGTTEPTTWQYTATDATAVLQKAAPVGLSSSLAAAATNAPVTFTFDDWRVTKP